jgi:prepilin-type N-terminal cleavage/methylation domain-containing protein
MSSADDFMSKRVTMRHSQQGFSLIELMVTILILTVIMGAIFSQIEQVQQRSVTEQSKLDMFQQAREFLDQMSSDLHQAGYPGAQQYSSANPSFVINTSLPTSPYAALSFVAAGLTKIDAGELIFEGDIDGSGNVSIVHYKYDTSGTNCPCLRRSVTQKLPYDPLSASQTAPSYSVEVQNVQNGTSTNPIFFAYSQGSLVTLPKDFDSNPGAIASIDTVQVVMTVQSPVVDPKTLLKPITTLVSTVRLGNCSAAYPGMSNSCQ